MLQLLITISLVLLSSADEMIVFPNVSATLGKDVEIRCSVLYYSYYDSVDCSGASCGIVWKFEGDLLQNSSRIQTSQFYSVGYAALAPDAVATARQIGLSTRTRFNREEYNRYSDNILSEAIVYLNSIVTIRRVTTEDLGTYTCNYSDPNPDQYYWRRPILVKNVTLYENDTATEKQWTTGIYSRVTGEAFKPSTIYAQCITYGGPPVWRARVATDNCSIYYNDRNNECEDNSLVSLEDLKTQDFYHCFNFVEATSSGSQYGFSVIKFTDVSCEPREMDNVVFYCLESNNDLSWKGYFSLTQAKVNAEDEQDYWCCNHFAASRRECRGDCVTKQDYSYRRNRDRWDEIPAGLSGVLTCLSVIVIAVIVVTSSRGKCCYSRRTLFATPIMAPVATVGAAGVPIQQPSAPPAYCYSPQ